MASSYITDSNDYLRVVAYELEAGNEVDFDITGEDLGNGYTDTSSHAAWYAKGSYATSYNGGDEMTRPPGTVGCAHTTEPNDQYTYPTGISHVRCVEDGVILFVQQLNEPLDNWNYEVVTGDFESTGGYAIEADGQIRSIEAGNNNFDSPVLHINVR